MTANLLSEVCNNVCIEPDLQPINGKQLMGNVEDGGKLDIAANEFWDGPFERTYINVRVFNPHAPSNSLLHSPPSWCPLRVAWRIRLHIFYKMIASNLALKWE